MIRPVRPSTRRARRGAWRSRGLHTRRFIARAWRRSTKRARRDRAAAFVLGLSSMIIAAHGGLTRFHVGDSIQARHVFNAARNVEIAAWMLSSRRDAQGRPLLLSNELGDGVANLSFEREFGRIIARLDLEASLQDESLRRIGINYVQGLLFFNFLPVR